MNKEEVLNLFKCLSDKSRLSILELLIREDSYVEKISQTLSLAPSTVSFHLKKLESCKIVNKRIEQYFTVYSVNKDVLNKKIIDLILMVSSNDLETGDILYRKNIINNFIIDGKLISIPVQRKKRRIILEEIVRSFEKNKKYTEKEVNLILADFNDDFCYLRREMITEKLMERENSIYWVI